MRFQTIATRARSASSLLEQGSSAQDEFHLLHSVMLSRTSVFRKWVLNEWYMMRSVQAAKLRTLDYEDLSYTEQTRSKKTRINTLIAVVPNVNATKQDE